MNIKAVYITRQINGCKKIVAQSRNLRAVLAYGRKIAGCHMMTASDKTLKVFYTNGAECETEFADASVLRDWVATRIRYGRGRWQGAL